MRISNQTRNDTQIVNTLLTPLSYSSQESIINKISSPFPRPGRKLMNRLIDKLASIIPHKRLNFDPQGNLIMSVVPYYLLTAITLLGLFDILNYVFFFIVFIYIGLPLADEVFTLDWRNPTSEQAKKLLEQDPKFKFAIYSAAVCDWIVFFKAMDYYSHYEYSHYTILNFVAFVFLISNLNATQFMVSHEIFHKPNKFDRVFGTLIMSKLLYMHFTYEHLWGHHRRVATPEDAASAQKGINVYRFIWRSYKGAYISVYNMEKELNKPFYQNTAILSAFCSVIFTLTVYWVWGPQAMTLFLITALAADAYLEAINYIEHYGLRRKKLSNGEYEKVTIRHSWNAPHRVSNYLLFKLQRHSDHHQNSLKPYQTLVSVEDSPMLPHGYSLMVMMSFFPEVWFSVMNPLVDEYSKSRDGQIDPAVMQKANHLVRKFMVEMAIGIVLVIGVINYTMLGYNTL